jgi:UPF0755 protein
MKKRIIVIGLIALSLFGCGIAGLLFAPLLHPPAETTLFVRTDDNFEDLMLQLKKAPWMRFTSTFEQIAKLTRLPRRLKPGRYDLESSLSLWGLVSQFRNAKRSEVRLVITKLRTKEDLASKIGKQFEADSAEIMKFLNSHDSLKKFDLDTNTAMTMVIPNSYLCWWHGPAHKILSRLHQQSTLFWKGKRGEKAKQLGLEPNQVYIIASIVEEETTRRSDKGKIARVYLNRLAKGMKLEADPTVKFALKRFDLTRIYFEHLKVNSPYNTYMNTGLPPGPICTPSIETIEAVLDAPPSDHIFFVAKPDFSGYSNFASTYPEHLNFARQYQQALNKLQAQKKP